MRQPLALITISASPLSRAGRSLAALFLFAVWIHLNMAGVPYGRASAASPETSRSGETASPTTTDGCFRLSGAGFELHVDRTTGQLADLVDLEGDCSLLAADTLSPVTIRTEHGWIGGPSEETIGQEIAWRCVSHRYEPAKDPKRLVAVARAGSWEVEQCWELIDNTTVADGPARTGSVLAGHGMVLQGESSAEPERLPPLVACRATFRYLGQQAGETSGKDNDQHEGEGAGGDTLDGSPPTVRGVRFWLAARSPVAADDTYYEISSLWPPARFPLDRLEPGTRRTSRHSRATNAAVVVQSREPDRGLIAAFYSESEWAHVAVTEQADHIEVAHDQQVLDRARPGRPIAVGTRLLCLSRGDWNRTMAACRDIYRRIGVVVPKDMARRGASSIIYSCHPGGTIDSGFSDVGHIDALKETLPRLADLGVNVIWLLPFYEGSVYAPVDYYRLEERWGDEASLRRFVDAAHAYGMNVLLDLIPHGPKPESNLHVAHRDWVGTTEDGQMRLWWGCLGCDYAHPGWQQFMADHAVDWIRRVGIDGFRVDCAAGSPPNWAATEGRRPSQSGLFGAVGLQRKVRQAMEAVKRPVYLLPEGEGVPLNTVGEFTYPWSFAFGVLPSLHEMPVEQWVPAASDWLQRQKLCMPEGANFAWFVENHDTRRAELVWGPNTHRALLAFCAFARGAPLLYQEQQVGYSHYVRRLYDLRQRHAVLHLGEADYLKAAASPPVMTILRRLGDQRAVAAINFSKQPVATKLRLPAWWVSGVSCDLPDLRMARVDDGLGRPVTLDSAIALEPFSYAVLLFGTEEALRRASAGNTLRRRGQAADEPNHVPSAPAATSPDSPAAEMLGNGRLRVLVSSEVPGLPRSLAWADSERNWIEGFRVIEGPQKFAPLRRPIRLAATGLQPNRWQKLAEADERRNSKTQQPNERTVLAYRSDTDPLFDLETESELLPCGRLHVRLVLTPRRDVAATLAQLATTFRVPAADGWAVRTIEGLLCDDAYCWRPRNDTRPHRYQHDTTGAYWQSTLFPLPPGESRRPHVYLFDRRLGRYLGIAAVASHQDWNPKLELRQRDGDRAEPTVVIRWLDGKRGVGLKAGETIRLNVILSTGVGMPWCAEPKTAVTDSSCEGLRPTLSAAAGNLVVGNGHFEAAIARSAGGTLRTLRVGGADRPVVVGSTLYTDKGLYTYTWRDSLGVDRNIFAHDQGECDPRVEVERECETLVLGFSGRLRHSAGVGTAVARPPTEYHIRYTFDSSPEIAVAVSVRPHQYRPEVRAFLAHRLQFFEPQRFAVTGNGRGVIGRFSGQSGRLWQAAGAEFPVQRAFIEVPGGVTEIQMMGPADRLQNWFFLDASGDGYAFMAMNDGQPAHIVPYWRTVEYRLRVSEKAWEKVLPQSISWASWPAQKEPHKP